MIDFGKIGAAVWSGLQALGGVGALIGIAAFLFREKIKSSLAESMASRLERERAGLALDQARLSSELTRAVETHKVALTAEAERLKARQQLKTSIALRLAERRYDAACTVYNALAGLPPIARAFALTDFSGAAEEFAIRKRRVEEEYVVVVDALKMNRAFIPEELFTAGMLTTKPIREISRRRATLLVPALRSDDPVVGELIVSFTDFERIFDGLLREFEAAS